MAFGNTWCKAMWNRFSFHLISSFYKSHLLHNVSIIPIDMRIKLLTMLVLRCLGFQLDVCVKLLIIATLFVIIRYSLFKRMNSCCYTAQGYTIELTYAFDIQLISMLYMSMVWIARRKVCYVRAIVDQCRVE